MTSSFVTVLSSQIIVTVTQKVIIKTETIIQNHKVIIIHLKHSTLASATNQPFFWPE